MEFLPKNKGLVIKIVDKATSTDSGLEIPAEQRRIIDRPSSGEVVAIGPNCEWVKVGMVIYFDKYKLIEVADPNTNQPRGAINEEDCLGELK